MQRSTTCNRDCPDACRITVHLQDGRAVRLSGDADDPITQGFLCERTKRFLDLQYAPDRLTHPMLRRDGQLERVSWDEALDFVAQRMLTIRRESGPHAILHYLSGGSLGVLKHLTRQVFDAFGPVTTKRGDICSGAGEHAQEVDFGVSDSHDLHDLLHSKTIVLWGKNPHTSGVHLLPILRRAQRLGARVIGVDVRRTKAAQLCDAFYTVRPGCDGPLSLAVARDLFDRGLTDPAAPGYCDGFEAYRALAHSHTVREWSELAGMAEPDVRAIAAAYGDGPSALLVGWGLARRLNGSATVRLLDALGAISGNLGVAGGGVSYYFQRSAAFDRAPLSETRTLFEPTLGLDILQATDPPIRAVWVTAGNPVAMLPGSQTVREALLSRELVVVVDTHPTDTTDVAHVVLPTLTLLEDDDLLGAYGNHYLRASTPAVEPPGQARHELWIMQQLAQRLGVGDAVQGSIAEHKQRMTQRLTEHGITPERLEREAVKNPFAHEVLFADRVFPTATGRVQLIHELPPLPNVDPRWPLKLLAISVPQAQSSQWSVPPPAGPMQVWVHPRSAPVPDGALATLRSPIAHMPVRVMHDPGLHPEVLFTAKGGQRRQNMWSNALVDAVPTDAGGGAAYYDQPVRLEAP